MTTLNLQSAPIQIGRYDSYLASSQISNVAQVGSTTADPGRRDQRLQHEPAAVRDGKRRDAAEDQHQHDLPADVRNADQRGLQSPVPELRHTTVRPEGTPAQRRDLGTSGFDQTTEDTNKVGTGDAGFFGLGGGLTRNTKREVIVVLITPVVLG